MTRIRRAAAVVFAVVVLGLFGIPGVAAAAAPSAPSAAKPADFNIFNPIDWVQAAAGVVTNPAGAAVSAGTSAAKIAQAAQCDKSPEPEKPSDGLSGWLDPGPATIPSANEDPFKPGAKTSIYASYGYAGLSPYQFDRPTIFGCAFNPNIKMTIAGFETSLATIIQAMQARLYSTMFSALPAVDAVQNMTAKMGGSIILIPLGGFAIMATAIYINMKNRDGDVAEAGTSAAKALLIIGLGAMCMVYSVGGVALVDKFNMGVLQAVSSGIQGQAQTSTMKTSSETNLDGTAVQRNDPRDASSAVASAVYSGTLYQAWLQSTFGRDNTAAAKKYGGPLFKSRVYSRAEAERIRGNPAAEKALREQKMRTYAQIARAIENEYPSAYRNLAGEGSEGPVGYWFVALGGSAFAAIFVIFALLRMVYGMVAARVGIAVGPIAAVFGQHPKFQDKTAEFGRWFLTLIIQSAGFAAFAILYAYACTTALMAPTSTINPFVKILMLGMLNVLGFVVAKKLGLIGSVRDAWATTKHRAGRVRDSVGDVKDRVSDGGQRFRRNKRGGDPDNDYEDASSSGGDSDFEETPPETAMKPKDTADKSRRRSSSFAKASKARNMARLTKGAITVGAAAMSGGASAAAMAAGKAALKAKGKTWVKGQAKNVATNTLTKSGIRVARDQRVMPGQVSSPSRLRQSATNRATAARTAGSRSRSRAGHRTASAHQSKDEGSGQ